MAAAHRLHHRVGVLERHQETVHVHDLGGAGNRGERVDRQRHRLLGADLQIPFLVGEHETPAEIAADDEGERDAVGKVRGHGAVAERAVVVAVGLALPSA